MDSSAEELSCEQHGQQTLLFCTYCESILCLECVNDHAGHGMITVQAAREEKQKLIAEQHSRMQELIRELQTAQERGDRLRGLAEAKHGEKTGSIEDAFKKGQADLRKWQQDELDKATQPHNETTRNLTDSSEKLRYAMEEGQGLSTAFDTLLGAHPATFLRNFKHLESKMEKQIRTANDRIAEHTAQFTRIESELQRDVVYPRELKVYEVVTDRGDSRERQTDDQSEQTSPKEATERTSPLPGKASCDLHNNRITMFCGTCDVTLCRVCFDEKHSNHYIRNIAQAFEEKKASLQSGLESWSLIKDALQETKVKLYSLKEEVEKCLGQRIDRINEEYRRQKEELKRCRQNVATVESLICRCTQKIEVSAPPVDRTLRDMEELDNDYVELLRRPKVWLLKESNKLAQRITEQASSAKEVKESAEDAMKEIQTFLEEESTVSEVNVLDTITETRQESPQDNADASTQTESVALVGPQDTPTDTQTSTSVITKVEGILTQQLKFTEASEPGAVTIEDEGLTVTDQPGKSARCISVRSDGLLSQSRYWEVAVSWRVCSPPLPPPPRPHTGWVLCTVGVRQEGSEFSSRLGFDSTSYGVEIHVHNTDGYCFDGKHQGKVTVSSEEQVLRDDSITNHLGFLLQAPERTLTVIDLDTETRFHTFRELDVSRPFVPVVWFGAEFFHRSVRLITADISVSLTRVLDIVKS